MQIVKRIFAMCIAGKGPNQIARILSNEKIVNPTNYYYQTYGKGHQKLDTTHPYNWIGSTITAILDNMAYLGHTVGLRHTTISYKNNINAGTATIIVKGKGNYTGSDTLEPSDSVVIITTDTEVMDVSDILE